MFIPWNSLSGYKHVRIWLWPLKKVKGLKSPPQGPHETKWRYSFSHRCLEKGGSCTAIDVWQKAKVVLPSMSDQVKSYSAIDVGPKMKSYSSIDVGRNIKSYSAIDVGPKVKVLLTPKMSTRLPINFFSVFLAPTLFHRGGALDLAIWLTDWLTDLLTYLLRNLLWLSEQTSRLPDGH